MIKMLKMIENNKLVRPEDVENEYKNCKYIITDFSDLQNIEGYLYCVSDSADSFKEICKINYDLSGKGRKSILLGSYNNGGAVGVQYEVER